MNRVKQQTLELSRKGRKELEMVFNIEGWIIRDIERGIEVERLKRERGENLVTDRLYFTMVTDICKGCAARRNHTTATPLIYSQYETETLDRIKDTFLLRVLYFYLS